MPYHLWKHRIESAFVYGSYAKETRLRPGSDLDVMVIGDVSFGEVVEHTTSAQISLAREINPTVYTPAEFAQRVRDGHHFLLDVLENPKLFLIGGPSELERLAEMGWLTKHQATADEIRELLAVADRDLHDSDVPGLSTDTQLGLAYNAALQVATAALAAEGYRAARDSKHLRTIESLALTIQLDGAAVRKFDAFRRKRNVSDYERAGTTSPREAVEMKAFAGELRRRVQVWLENNHGELT